MHDAAARFMLVKREAAFKPGCRGAAALGRTGEPPRYAQQPVLTTIFTRAAIFVAVNLCYLARLILRLLQGCTRFFISEAALERRTRWLSESPHMGIGYLLLGGVDSEHGMRLTPAGDPGDKKYKRCRGPKQGQATPRLQSVRQWFSSKEQQRESITLVTQLSLERWAGRGQSSMWRCCLSLLGLLLKVLR